MINIHSKSGAPSDSIGAPATVTVNGFKYRIRAGQPTLVPQYTADGQPVIASPGSDFIAIPIILNNLQTDRQAQAVDAYGVFVAKSAANTYGSVQRTVLSTNGASIDCSSFVNPHPAGDCPVGPGGNVLLPDGTSLGYATAQDLAIAPGGTANLTIYTVAVAPTASLHALVLYANVIGLGSGGTAVPLP